MQKMIKKYRKAKGFTLVELLIVIIIIGILAGMMMLSTGSATDKAEATKIVSNMRNIKAAAIMFYADENHWPSDGEKESLDVYLDQKIFSGTGKDDRYTIDGTSADGYSVKFTAALGGGTTKGVMDKLKAMDAVQSADDTAAYMPISKAGL